MLHKTKNDLNVDLISFFLERCTLYNPFGCLSKQLYIWTCILITFISNYNVDVFVQAASVLIGRAAGNVQKPKMSIFSASGGPREKLNPFLESSFRVHFGFVDADEVNVMNLVFLPRFPTVTVRFPVFLSQDFFLPGCFFDAFKETVKNICIQIKS